MMAHAVVNRALGSTYARKRIALASRAQRVGIALVSRWQWIRSGSAVDLQV